ncbi:tyrosine-protein phosphatase [Erythrobacter sp. W53]|uniref:tyrosine-protein phosphatase n=1 Tax=Erythrobacter sp. W53 TaxID=3425947 RepID=UPI003D76673D
MIRSEKPDPFIPTEGIHNLRDYGGYNVAGGGTIRTGLLFRSGQHVSATDADLEAFHSLDVRTIIDLRGNSEREQHACLRAPEFDAQVVYFDGETSSSPPHMDVAPGTTTAEYARQRMTAVYSRMPHNPAMIDMFGRYFRALDERDGGSLVHCFAGKDRTGVAAMMLMHVLGASKDDQMHEFLLTNAAPTINVLRDQSVPGIEARLGLRLDEDAVRALLEVHQDYLARYWQEVESEHGTLDAYLESVIGVDDAMRERLKARFLA